jgi:hypothetical protein
MIYVCSNYETVTDGYVDLDMDSVSKTEICDVYNVAVFAELNNAKIEFECDSTFRNWHGGKFDQFYKRAGYFIAAPKDTSEKTMRILDEADSAGIAAMQIAIEEYEQSASEAE